MLRRKSKVLKIVLLSAIAVFLILSATSSNVASAGGGTIAATNNYPDDGGTYEFVDYFSEQTTAVNTNTTVLVSVDGGPLIPMTFKGVRKEIAPEDSVSRDWYTWETAVPAITRPGNHIFQFFSRYYVWQDADICWAEFNAQSSAKSFTINSNSPPSSHPPQPTETNQVHIFAGVAASSAALLLLIASFLPRKPSGSKVRTSP